MAKLVAGTYADALFGLAAETDRMELLTQEAEEILQILRENPKFETLMTHPRISTQEKREILESVFTDRVSEEMMGFLQTVEAKGRFREIEAMLTCFIAQSREYQGIGVARITSAQPLQDAQKQAVEKRLLETTSYTSFLLEFHVDPTLIGGMKVQIGDRIVDGSIRTRLDRLTQSLRIQVDKSR